MKSARVAFGFLLLLIEFAIYLATPFAVDVVLLLAITWGLFPLVDDRRPAQ